MLLKICQETFLGNVDMWTDSGKFIEVGVNVWSPLFHAANLIWKLRLMVNGKRILPRTKKLQ